MRVFLWNVVLALVWATANGRFTLPDLALGFGLGYLVLLFAERGTGPSPYFARAPRVIRFALFYLWQMVLSNLRLAHDLVTPTYFMRPGVIAVPLDAKTDTEITLLANLITLTPGSVSLDLSPDRLVLYVHVMYIDHGDVDEARRRIKDDLERRVLEVLR
jgi:multicomponent Na+:H+ antiporter subunit E